MAAEAQRPEDPVAPARPVPQRMQRASDRGVLCQIALRASQLWDFIDQRQIDAHFLTLFIGWGTYRIMAWSMHFADASTRPGMEVAAILAAVLTPWAAVQGAAVKFYFDARR